MYLNSMLYTCTTPLAHMHTNSMHFTHHTQIKQTQGKMASIISDWTLLHFFPPHYSSFVYQESVFSVFVPHPQSKKIGTFLKITSLILVLVKGKLNSIDLSEVPAWFNLDKAV